MPEKTDISDTINEIIHTHASFEADVSKSMDNAVLIISGAVLTFSMSFLVGMVGQKIELNYVDYLTYSWSFLGFSIVLLLLSQACTQFQSMCIRNKINSLDPKQAIEYYDGSKNQFLIRRALYLIHFFTPVCLIVGLIFMGCFIIKNIEGNLTDGKEQQVEQSKSPTTKIEENNTKESISDKIIQHQKQRTNRSRAKRRGCCPP